MLQQKSDETETVLLHVLGLELPPLFTVTEKVPPVLTVMQRVVAPLLHK
jgi:hypothetical protein